MLRQRELKEGKIVDGGRNSLEEGSTMLDNMSEDMSEDMLGIMKVGLDDADYVRKYVGKYVGASFHGV